LHSSISVRGGEAGSLFLGCARENGVGRCREPFYRAPIPPPAKDALARAGCAGRRSLTGGGIDADAGHGLCKAAPALRRPARPRENRRSCSARRGGGSNHTSAHVKTRHLCPATRHPLGWMVESILQNPASAAPSTIALNMLPRREKLPVGRTHRINLLQ
jgi:hypothetical protein